MTLNRFLLSSLAAAGFLASAATAFAKEPVVDLTTALSFIDHAKTQATQAHAHVAIAIVDAGGNLVAFQRMDQTQLGSTELAIRKAETALRFTRPTVDMEHALNKGNFMIATLPNALPAGGGYPIRVNGVVVGALGLSGGEGETDANVAHAAVDAALKSGALQATE